MKLNGPRLSPCRPQQASALIIVLLFLVLLTGLVVLFLSRSLTALIVANRSSGMSKVSILANSAGDMVIGDLKQEIIDGSTSSNVASGYIVYTPKVASAISGGQSTATPAISGFIPTYTSGVENDGLANLLKVSKYGVAPYSSSTNANFSATGVSRASNVSSSAASLNGRTLTATRWNAHYLVGRQTTGSSYDSTPVSGFPMPDWVIVSRGGARTAYAAYTSTLADASANNTNYAIGRFAYAIYNEGGLLDMNAAGYPANDASGGSVGLSTNTVAHKGSLAMADLMQLPVSSSNSSAVLTQTQINNFIGWRNYYTSQFTSANGNFGAFKFDATSSQNWLTNFVNYNGTNGYMTLNTNSLTVPAPPTDQALLSRQQLINLTRAIGISPDALQYMGTFSRALEQPSYTPDPNRPRVIGTAAPPDASIVDSYYGNNDAYGGDDVINPAFLNIRVLNSFTRIDGTTAVVGEPLVKRKFALSRLGLVSYQATASKSQSDAIYARFGLYRGDTSSPWTYDHGITGSSGGVIIGTLAQVAAAGREPDFAELLKAAITVGSLAKGGPGLHNGQGNYQYTVDTAVDYQVLQIMANLIDQYDTDSYPTVIQIASGSYMRQFAGVEDLPYFYRYHLFSVVTRLPSPISASTDYQTFAAVPPGTTSTGSTTTATMLSSGSTMSETWSVANAASVNYYRCKKQAMTDAGEAVYLYVPDLWNPHDYNLRSNSSASGRPASYRIYASTTDPLGSTPAWSTVSESNLSDSSSTGGGQIVPEKSTDGAYVYPCSTPTQLSLANKDWITFSDNTGRLFREPTLLWSGNPTGISIAGTTATKTVEINTGKTYYGIPVGRGPVSMQASFASTPTALSSDGTYTFQGVSLTQQQVTPPGAFANVTFFLQYQDPNNVNNWITYDVKYPDLHGMTGPNLAVNTADYTNSGYYSPLKTGQFSSHASSFDPRTARWGIGTASSLGQSSSNGIYLLEPSPVSNFNTATAAGYTAVGKFCVLETQRPRADKGNQVNYSNPGMTSDPGKNQQMRIFSGVGFSATNGSTTSPLEYDGLMSQNNPLVSFKARDHTTNAQLYFEDADGMVRRAMGAYAAYASTTIDVTGGTSLAQVGNYSPGLPLITADTITDFSLPQTITPQNESRPMILNRPFTNVMDMSYAFRGTPWKNIDFFTAESGDAPLLDVFCVNEPPSNAMVAGKVDLNTRQVSVLQSLISGAYRDEFATATTPPSYALAPLSSTEARNIATKLVGITTDTSNNWRGALANISGLVGRFVPNPGSTSATDLVAYTQPSAPNGASSAGTYVYAGLASAIDSATYSYPYSMPLSTPASSVYIIQRFRESGLRPLADAGQTRVWNLLIDVVAQTGKYPPTATGLDQFAVDGEKRLWIHVAIDRYTGQVIDKQVEVVTP